MKKNKNVVNNLLELVGNTPMVKINKLTKDEVNGISNRFSGL